MDLDCQIYIACTNCAKTKAKCDKKTPCTRCVTKNLVCEPRRARRSLNAMAQRQNAQLRTLEPQTVRDLMNGARNGRRPMTSAGVVGDGSPGVLRPRSPRSQKAPPFLHQTPPQTDAGLTDHMAMNNSQRASQTQNNSPRTSPVSVAASMQWHISPESESQAEEESIMGNNRLDDSRMVDSNMPHPSGDYGFLHLDNPQAMMDLDMSDITNPMFCDLGFPDYYSTGLEPIYESRLSDPMYQVTVQDHPLIVAAQEAWPLFRCNPRTTSTQYPSTAGIHLQGLEQTLTSEYVWTTMYDAQVDPSPSRRITIESIQSPSRDKLLAVTQILFHDARKSGAMQDQSNPDQISNSFLILPPPNIMDNFLRTYGNCFESYYRMTAGNALKPGEMMLHQDSKVSTILILLMVAFGALLVPTMGARHIAGGLTEVCRIALWSVLERDMTLSSDPMVSHCALLYLTLGIWSGDKWQMDIALAQRGMYIYMLRHVEVPRPIPGDQGNTEVVWRYWREQESQNRLKYAWVMADQEWSLFQDTAAMISINTLQEPMPSAERLWKADTAAEWARLMKDNQGTDSAFPISLRDLYRSFTDGEVLKSRQQLSATHLRLLLHPLQGLVCHLRQSLQCFTDYGGNRGGSRALSQTTAQAQLSQAHQVLQQWYTLSTRCSPSETNCSPIFFSSLVIYHLITLNTMISFTDIEEVATRGSSKIYSFERKRSSRAASPWHEICPTEETEEIFFHCGQLMRLFCIVPQAVKAIWWPAVLYRVALTTWFTSMATSNATASSPWDSSQSAHQSTHSTSYQSTNSYLRGTAHSSTSGHDDIDPTFAIDALPPDDATLARYLKYKEGEPMFSRPGGGYVSLRDPPGVLRHCVNILDLGVTSRLREGIKNKLELLAERWGN